MNTPFCSVKWLFPSVNAFVEQKGHFIERIRQFVDFICIGIGYDIILPEIFNLVNMNCLFSDTCCNKLCQFISCLLFGFVANQQETEDSNLSRLPENYNINMQSKYCSLFNSNIKVTIYCYAADGLHPGVYAFRRPATRYCFAAESHRGMSLSR
jgi:hypothetical protein